MELIVIIFLVFIAYIYIVTNTDEKIKYAEHYFDIAYKVKELYTNKNKVSLRRYKT